jgi:hypothetical protein
MPKLKTKSPIHDTITGYDFEVDPPLVRSKAIRQKCLECCCGQSAEVARCHITDCTLWPWRFGSSLEVREKRMGRNSRVAANAEKDEPTRIYETNDD